jgi:hypothetical protein
VRRTTLALASALLAGCYPAAAVTDRPALTTATGPAVSPTSPGSPARLAPTVPATPAEKVAATALHGEYVANALSADRRYRDKPVTVSGDFAGLKQARDGRYYLTLSVANSSRLPWPGSIPGVVAYVEPGSEGGFTDLKPPTHCSLAGVCRGALHDPACWKGTAVVLDGCRRAP